MICIDDVYQRTVADNEKSLRFWEDYLNKLKSLDFSVYTEKLKVPTLVPVGSRIFFKGELKHTNEVTVSLGADYFVKCSIQQAEILKQHRIKDAQSKIDIFLKEKQYLENHLSFTKQNVYDEVGQEIIEQFTEEENKAWRKQHRENVRKYKQSKGKEDIKQKEEISDNELWERLEEVELQEELENEMLINYTEIVDMRKKSLIDNKRNIELFEQENNKLQSEANFIFEQKDNINKMEGTGNNNRHTFTSEESSKHKLLQQVLNKQNELEIKLHKLQNRDREISKTEQDLLCKLDELEQFDELEDEINRLDDILKTEDVDLEVTDSSTHYSGSETTKLKKSIHFQDKDDSKTIEITFRHSTTKPGNDLYNPKNGITKPSDIYEAFPCLFADNPKSILKKSKYDSEEKMANQTKEIKFAQNKDSSEHTVTEDMSINREIIINDVVVVNERLEKSQKINDIGARPTSLFKKKRLQQNKT